MKKIIAVATREFIATVLTKGFILGVFLPPIFIAIVATVTPMLLNKAGPKVSGHIAVIDRTGVVAPRLTAAFTPEAMQARRDDRFKKVMSEVKLPDDLKKQAMEGQMGMAAKMPAQPDFTVEVLDSSADVEEAKAPIRQAAGKEKDAGGTNPRLALVVIPPEAVKAPESGALGVYDIFTAPKLDVEVTGDIENQVTRAVVDARIEAANLNVETIRGITKMGRIEAKAVTATGDQKVNEVAQLLIPGAFMLLLWISVFTCGQYLLTSTIEEKSSRVMEVLLSAVSPIQLMSGKILGQMCVGLLILTIYSGVGMVGLAVAAMQHLLDPMNLVYLGIYFLIAFALIASLMAAVGSAVSDIREAQSLMGPIMIVLVIPMMLWMPILRNPNSTFAQVCSFIPPISPFVMVLRLAGSEKIPGWQVPLSIVIGIASVAVALWAAAKIFRIGVLMYGKPPNFKTLFKWVRMA